MNKREKSKKEYHTLKEFQEDFYPVSEARKLIKAEDPHLFGVNLARESLKKIEHLLSKSGN